MSNKTSIKVQYVNQPKSAKGPGSVKTDNGVYYKVWKDLLPQFENGKTYEIEYDTEQYNGQDKFVARKILSSSESSNGTTARVEDYVPKNGSDNRSARIERQAALKVAVQFHAIEVQTAQASASIDGLFAIADKIVGYINTPDSEKAAAPVEAQEVEI